MILTFVHLSDLHYRKGWQEQNELVWRIFLEDLKEQIQSTPNTHLIFSGDHVQSGEDSSAYNHISTSLSMALAEAGLNKEKRICVPGNHDVNRSTLQRVLPFHKSSLDAIPSEQQFNDFLPELSKLFFEHKFENYKNYESNLAKYSCCTQSLGGSGWITPENIAIYCLNTSLCSYAGLHDQSGNNLQDQGNLMVDTRSLYEWIPKTDKCVSRILVLHHPIDWLCQWAQTEIDTITHLHFDLVFSGHTHTSSATWSSRTGSNTVFVKAPPLFTSKHDLLGYSITSYDTTARRVCISYRQWTPQHKFVTGTSLSANDTGKVIYDLSASEGTPFTPSKAKTKISSILEYLENDFNEACTYYASKRSFWVDRDLAEVSETDSEHSNATLLTIDNIVSSKESCFIRAPKQFGLTCFGKRIALEIFRHSDEEEIALTVETDDLPHHKFGLTNLINAQLAELSAQEKSFTTIIIDNWREEKPTRKATRELKSLYPNLRIILLQPIDDCAQISQIVNSESYEDFKTYFLWALNRSQIRQLVSKYIEDIDTLDEDLVTQKVLSDLNALNIHRSPQNCLLLLKLAEQAFDDSPVNRTEMIGRVLYMLFAQYDKIPRYATRPDLKDCEYALGYFCEWLIQNRKSSFGKSDFFRKVGEYCSTQLVEIDIDVLFAFLATESILIRKGIDFGFRFSYWLYYFAAHRMHHSPAFAKYILDDYRYAEFPEILEFYAGIDRRRTDAVIQLTDDLQKMNTEFLERTGIDPLLNPYRDAFWSPSNEAVLSLENEVKESAQKSALPAVVKDSFADLSYDRSRPYSQELSTFIEQSTLSQLMQAMKGASRVLRNSDHVLPAEKAKLLEQLISCWTRVCQIIVLISPVLAMKRSAAFENVCFVLSKGFDEKSDSDRWLSIMNEVVSNVVNWYRDDFFSRKMGPLLYDYLKNNTNTLGELITIVILIKNRPPNWNKSVEKFIIKESKNSFYLFETFRTLRRELNLGFPKESTKHEIRRLAAMAIAKHSTGAKHPNISLVKKAEEHLAQQASNSTAHADAEQPSS